MESDLKIKLVHFNMPDLGDAWKHYFEFESNIEIINDDILDVGCDALVSPGNSFGFMDGGLDFQIVKKYGWEIQTKLKSKIMNLPQRELLVGQAISIQVTNSNKIIICAPTMRVPTCVDIPNSVNAYLAMKAILIECNTNPNIKSVAISGLCTGTGQMDAKVCAHQMFMAYNEIIKGNLPDFPSYMDAKKYEAKLKKSIL